jgi:hypothetical protein
MSIKPISPDEVAEAKREAIPDYVFAAVNDLIARHYTEGSCKIMQNELIEEIIKSSTSLIGQGLTPLTRAELFKRGYLNFEEAYRDAGWKVVYDKPAYNESYDPFFKFIKKN